MKSTPVEVEPDHGGVRLDRFLAERLDVSRARVRHLLEVGRVVHAGRVLTLSDKSRRTTPGERFEVQGSLRAEDERPVPRSDLPLDVVAEGRGWLVVDKPAGRGVHPLRPDQDDTVLNAVVARRPEILGVGEGGLRSGVVHRLDVETSGALAFATDEVLWKRLRGAFAEHRVHKRYVALVWGRFESARRVDLPLAVTRHSPAHVGVVEGGYACRQRVEPLEVFDAATLVAVRLETGFLHQIRASMAHVGHPIVGDAEYSDPDEHARIDVPRQMLHAMHLAVDEIRVEVPLPADMEAVLSELRAEKH